MLQPLFIDYVKKISFQTRISHLINNTF